VSGTQRRGQAHPAETPEKLMPTTTVKVASNGLPVQLDTTPAQARAATLRGKASFSRRVAERNHACADCHTPEHGANRSLGGRLLADASVGLTRHFPTWRTDRGEVWDLRKRFQWCMTPLGTNMLAADAIE